MRELEDEYEFKCRRRSITYLTSDLTSEMHEGFEQLNGQFEQQKANIKELTNSVNSMIQLYDNNFLLLSRGQSLNLMKPPPSINPNE